jgi:hypothetical protein
MQVIAARLTGHPFRQNINKINDLVSSRTYKRTYNPSRPVSGGGPMIGAELGLVGAIVIVLLLAMIGLGAVAILGTHDRQ